MAEPVVVRLSTAESSTTSFPDDTKLENEIAIQIKKISQSGAENSRDGNNLESNRLTNDYTTNLIAPAGSISPLVVVVQNS
jgi:hypothetical protein